VQARGDWSREHNNRTRESSWFPTIPFVTKGVSFTTVPTLVNSHARSTRARFGRTDPFISQCRTISLNACLRNQIKKIVRFWTITLRFGLNVGSMSITRLWHVFRNINFLIELVPNLRETQIITYNRERFFWNIFPTRKNKKYFHSEEIHSEIFSDILCLSTDTACYTYAYVRVIEHFYHPQRSFPLSSSVSTLKLKRRFFPWLLIYPLYIRSVFLFESQFENIICIENINVSEIISSGGFYDGFIIRLSWKIFFTRQETFY